MPWGRLDDSLYDHPKVEALVSGVRNACIGLWIRAISCSNRYLTDGFISAERLRKLDATRTHVEALITVGLFDREDGGVRIHDFLQFNDSADEVRQRRAEMRELGKRGGQRSGEARRLNRDGEALRLNSRPVPSSPVPSLPNPPYPPLKNGDEPSPPTGALAEIYRQHEKAATVPIRSLVDRGIKRP